MGLNEVEKASVYYSNAGNLIIPIVTFVLGKDWVLYGCVFMSVQIVFIWSHGKCVLSREQGNKQNKEGGALGCKRLETAS